MSNLSILSSVLVNGWKPDLVMRYKPQRLSKHQPHLQSLLPPCFVYALTTRALVSWKILCVYILFFKPSPKRELRSLRAWPDSASGAGSGAGSGTSLILNSNCTYGVEPSQLSRKITISVTCLIPSSALCWASKKASEPPSGDPEVRQRCGNSESFAWRMQPHPDYCSLLFSVGAFWR